MPMLRSDLKGKDLVEEWFKKFNDDLIADLFGTNEADEASAGLACRSFRPKKRALGEDQTEPDGYYWLAFDWKNYRIADSYPNSPHKDDSNVTRGKWECVKKSGVRQ